LWVSVKDDRVSTLPCIEFTGNRVTIPVLAVSSAARAEWKVRTSIGTST